MMHSHFFCSPQTGLGEKHASTRCVCHQQVGDSRVGDWENATIADSVAATSNYRTQSTTPSFEAPRATRDLAGAKYWAVDENHRE